MVGLHFIHDLNIVHLDIKPYNILFSQKVIFVIGIREVNQKENLWNLSELGLRVENNRLRAGPGAGGGGAGGHREAAGHHRVHVAGGDELQAGGDQRRPVERGRGQLHAAHRRQVALLRRLQVSSSILTYSWIVPRLSSKIRVQYTRSQCLNQLSSLEIRHQLLQTLQVESRIQLVKTVAI